MIPFNVERIDHIVLRVSDLQRSIEFYGQVLGCAVDRNRPDLGLVHLRTGASMIDLVDINGPLGVRGGRAPGDEGRNVDHVCLRVDRFDEARIHEHLARFGLVADAAQRRYGAEGTGYSLYFPDPDGNQVEIKGPSET